jgi:hypothetical protein
MSNPENPATYAGVPIPQPPQRFTRTQQLELLMWHPLFTGKCPHCRQAIAQTDSSLSAWQCSECGWHDIQPE